MKTSGVNYLSLLRTERHLLLRRRSTWLIAAIAVLLFTYGVLSFPEDDPAAMGHPELACGDMATGVMILVGMVGVLTSSRDHTSGRAVLLHTATARPYRLLAAKIHATTEFTLAVSVVAVVLMHLTSLAVMDVRLIPDLGSISGTWAWAAILVNLTLMIIAVLWGAALRNSLIGCITWFTITYLAVLLPDQLALWFPNIAMRTAALPGYTHHWWGDLQTSTQGWLVLAAWVTAVTLAALTRQHITGTQPPHGPLSST